MRRIVYEVATLQAEKVEVKIKQFKELDQYLCEEDIKVGVIVTLTMSLIM
jgi:hypothetical protein